MTAPKMFTRLVAGSLKPTEFTHEAHILAAWQCLQQPMPDSITPFAAGLKSLATRAGAPGRYHATITGAFLTLIAASNMPGESFAQFKTRNPTLWQRNCLAPYYSKHRLNLAEARQWFLMPDLSPLPACSIPLARVELTAPAHQLTDN